MGRCSIANFCFPTISLHFQHFSSNLALTTHQSPSPKPTFFVTNRCEDPSNWESRQSTQRVAERPSETKVRNSNLQLSFAVSGWCQETSCFVTGKSHHPAVFLA